MNSRRIRGFFSVSIATAIPWTALGLLAGVVFQFDLIPGVHGALGRPIPGGFLTVGTFAGAVIGLVNGVAFASVLLAAERGKRVDELRPGRLAVWGALATAGSLGLLIQNPLAAAIGAGLGGVGGFAMLWAARRARVRTFQAPSTVT
jgi:hypothetical protein